MTEIKTENELLSAVKELRTEFEAKSQDLGKIAKIEAALDEAEKKSQTVVAERMKEQKAAQELAEKVDLLEKQLARTPVGDADKERYNAEAKAFNLLARKGAAVLNEEERKYLRTDSDTEGGYLVPQDYVREIIKNMTEISPIRQLAKVRRTSSKSITIPKRTGLPQGGWRSEGKPKVVGQSSYGQVEIFTRSLDVMTDITTEMLQDSAFNMEEEIRSDVMEDFAQLEAIAFLYGIEGLNQPEGILVNPQVPSIASGVSNAITGDNLIDLQAALKIGYNGQYLFNRRTLAVLRKLKDSTGQYLWTPGFGSIQNQINGSNYILTGAGTVNDADGVAINVGMPDVAAGTVPVVYGDFNRAYTIVDHTDMTMIRDPYTQADRGKVRFVFGRRVGGKVVLPEALVKLRTAVS